MKKFILNDLKAVSCTLIYSGKLDKVFHDYSSENSFEFNLESYKDFVTSSIRSYGITEFVDVMSTFINDGISKNTMTIEDAGIVGEMINTIKTDGIALFEVVDKDNDNFTMFYRNLNNNIGVDVFNEFGLSVYDNHTMMLEYANRAYYCLAPLLKSFLEGNEKVLVFSDNVIQLEGMILPADFDSTFMEQIRAIKENIETKESSVTDYVYDFTKDEDIDKFKNESTMSPEVTEWLLDGLMSENPIHKLFQFNESKDITLTINEYKIWDEKIDDKIMAYSISNIFKTGPAIRIFADAYDINENQMRRDNISWMDVLTSRGPIKFFKFLYDAYKVVKDSVEVHSSLVNLMETHNGSEFVINLFLDRNEILAFRGIKGYQEGDDVMGAIHDAFNRNHIKFDGEVAQYNGKEVYLRHDFMERFMDYGSFTIGDLPKQREIVINDEPEEVVGDDDFKININKPFNVDKGEDKPSNDTGEPVKAKRPRISSLTQYKSRRDSDGNVRGTSYSKNFPRRTNENVEDLFENVYIQDIVYNILKDENYNDLTLEELVESFDQKEIELFEKMYNINKKINEENMQNTLSDENLNGVVNSYINTGLWSEELDNDDITIDESDVTRIKEDVIKFYNMVADKFGNDKANELFSIEGNDVLRVVGHDLYLSRNGHGAGFFDDTVNYGGLGDELQELARQMGNDDLFELLSLDYEDIEDGETFTESQDYDPSYTHFVINKADNTIIDGYDYSGLDKESIVDYVKQDLKDNFDGDVKLKDVKILTRAAAIKQGIDLKQSNSYIKFESIILNSESGRKVLNAMLEGKVNGAITDDVLKSAIGKLDKTKVKRLAESIKLMELKSINENNIDIIKVANNMIEFGGGFVSKLGEALLRADSENRRRIVDAFPEYIEQYSKM